MQKATQGSIATGSLRLKIICLLLATLPVAAGAGTVPQRNGSLTLPGDNYTLRFSDDFKVFNGNVWTKRADARTTLQIALAACEKDSAVDDASTVSVNGGELVISAFTDSAAPTDPTVLPHREHHGGGLISIDQLGYGYYEVMVNPYLGAAGLHTAFWNFASAGGNVLEIDALELDSKQGSFRSSGEPDQQFPKISSKSFLNWLPNEKLDKPSYPSNGAGSPWQARGYYEFRTDATGWILSGFDYGPKGVRFFENGVEVSHSDHPDSIPTFLARESIWLTAKAGLDIFPMDPNLTSAAQSRFKDIKFYAADYFDTNLLPNGDFEYSQSYTLHNYVTSKPSYTLVNDKPKIVNNACQTDPLPAAYDKLVGTTYPLQWLFQRADTSVATKENSKYQLKVVADPSPGNADNKALKLSGANDVGAELPNIDVFQEHKHINPGNYTFRGRAKLPTGFSNAVIKITYSLFPSGVGTITRPLMTYSTTETPYYKEIPPVDIPVGEQQDNTFVKFEIIAQATAGKTNGLAVATNDSNQPLEIYLDDLQFYKKSSATATPPVRSSDAPYDYSKKLVYKNYDTSIVGAQYYAPTTGTGFDWQNKFEHFQLLDRSMGGNAAYNPVEFTVSVDLYPDVMQDTVPVIKMSSNAADLKRGWAVGLTHDGIPYCAVGSLGSANQQVLNLGTTPVTQSGARVTCTYQVQQTAPTGTIVRGYVNGAKTGPTTFTGFYHEQRSIDATAGQYGHTKHLLSGGNQLRINDVPQEDYTGHLANLTLWHRRLSDTEVLNRGGAPAIP